MTDESLFGITPYGVACRAELPLSTPQSAVLKLMGTEDLTEEETKIVLRLAGVGFLRGLVTSIVRPYREIWGTFPRRVGKTTRLLACGIVSNALDPQFERNGAPGERFKVGLSAPLLSKNSQALSVSLGLMNRLGVRYETRADEGASLLDRPVDLMTMVPNVKHGSTHTLKGFFWDDACKSQTFEGERYDKHFLESVRPMLLSTGGPLRSFSQAWAREGVHYETIEKFRGRVDRPILAMQGMPAWEWVDHLTREDCWRLSGEDPRTFKREMEGVPGANEDALLEEDDLERARRPGVTQIPPKAGVVYKIVGDLALRGADFCVVGVGHREMRRLPNGDERDVLVIDALVAWRARPGRPLEPEAVIEEIARLSRKYNGASVWLDQHQYDFASALLRKRGVRVDLLKTDLASQAKRAEIFGARLRSRPSGVELLDIPEAMKQLGRLRVRLRSQGMYSYEAPTARDHDDYPDVIFGLAEVCQSGPTSGVDYKEQLIVDREPGCGMSVRLVRYRERTIGGITVTEPLPPERGTPDWNAWCREKICVDGMVGGEEIDAFIREELGPSPEPEQIEAFLERVRAQGIGSPDGDHETFVGVVGNWNSLESRLANTPSWKNKIR